MEQAVEPPAGATVGVRKRGRINSKLTIRQKEYVVERLAGFDSPVAIVKGLKEEFGVTVTRQAVEQYDRKRRRKCAPRWERLFDATRRTIIEGKAACGVASAPHSHVWSPQAVAT